MRALHSVGRICLGVAAVTAVTLGTGACSSDEGKAVSLDASTMTQALTDRGLTVSRSFTFADGYGVKGFVGTASCGARYDGSEPIDRAGAEIVDVNPTFPAMQPISCADPVLVSPDRPTDFGHWTRLR
ncbi:hypothetical protein ABH922_005111 [Rhodococcus sp. 27YEA15]